jgi:hypothetical protein
MDGERTLEATRGYQISKLTRTLNPKKIYRYVHKIGRCHGDSTRPPTRHPCFSLTSSIHGQFPGGATTSFVSTGRRTGHRHRCPCLWHSRRSSHHPRCPRGIVCPFELDLDSSLRRELAVESGKLDQLRIFQKKEQ